MDPNGTSDLMLPPGVPAAHAARHQRPVGPHPGGGLRDAGAAGGAAAAWISRAGIQLAQNHADPLADAGYHVIAPDQRGYGGTTGWDSAFDGDVASFRNAAYARDALGVVSALGYRSVAVSSAMISDPWWPPTAPCSGPTCSARW